jgi:transcriptional regulator with XRE-family HTH domain
VLLSQGANKLQMSESELYDIITDSVKRERKKRGISQLKLALILGHQSASYVARIELRQDAVNYNLSHLLKIADEFEIDIKDLIPNSRV